MNGLLDFIKTPEGQGLLSATFGGLAGARRGQPLNSIGRAGLAGISGYGNALEMQQKEADTALQQRVKTAELDKQKRLEEQALKKQATLSEMFAPGAAAPNYAQLIAQGMLTPDQAVAVADAGNLGKQKVARTVKGIEDGREVEYQVDQFGQRVGQGMAQYKEPLKSDTGGAISFLNPYDLKPLLTQTKTQTPDGKASNEVAWANNRIAGGNLGLARERLAFDKTGGADAMKPKFVDGQWIAAPVDMKPGETRQALPTTAKRDADEALKLIQSAREIIPKSTGSYLGSGVDQAARVFGASTGGDTAAAQLKALEGALVSKMPKMSGPQSDKDVLLYKQMAGEIGDPTIPQSRKIAALQVIEEIQARQAGVQKPAAPVDMAASPITPYADPLKESSYQAWKKRQAK